MQQEGKGGPVVLPSAFVACDYYYPNDDYEYYHSSIDEKMSEEDEMNKKRSVGTDGNSSNGAVDDGIKNKSEVHDGSVENGKEQKQTTTTATDDVRREDDHTPTTPHNSPTSSSVFEQIIQNKKIKPNSSPPSSSLSSVNSMMTDTKTHFPHFLDLDELALLSDEELLDYDSDDDDEGHGEQHLLEGLENKYKVKEDEDVAVFLRIADRMSLSSLLHILQGHVRAKNDSSMYNSSQQQKKQKEEKVTKPPVVKQFRWAVEDEQANDWKIFKGEAKVKVVTKEIEPYKHMKELWFSKEEFNTIRGELLKTIMIFSKFRTDYLQKLEIVYKGEESNDIIENYMKQLTGEDSYVRGLESHMVSLVKQRRTKHSHEVLRQQRVCKTRGDDYTKFADCLRKQSLLHSTMLVKFAVRIGKCDEIEALTANMSHWEQPIKE